MNQEGRKKGGHRLSATKKLSIPNRSRSSQDHSPKQSLRQLPTTIFEISDLQIIRAPVSNSRTLISFLFLLFSRSFPLPAHVQMRVYLYIIRFATVTYGRSRVSIVDQRIDASNLQLRMAFSSIRGHDARPAFLARLHGDARR